MVAPGDHERVAVVFIASGHQILQFDQLSDRLGQLPMIAVPTRQVAELLRHVDGAWQARQGECERFLTDLSSRLSAARIVRASA